MSNPRFSLVCFDVDSTLVTIEGVDVLANGREDVRRLTEGAMEGRIPVDEVYSRRLDMIRPNRDAIERLAGRYLVSMVPGASEVIQTLRDEGAEVHLVTAGIEQAILPLSRGFGLPDRACHAVRLDFDERGEYLDYDRRSFLTKPGGKEVVVLDLRARCHGRAAFVGDGITDAETRDAVDLFIGFGGVAVRPRVRELAHVWVEQPDLRAILPFLRGEA